MAMLAEPRRKQKVINLRAKNNAWSNDSSKFGQRMLEKMGWSSGKGLGANENGITEHVIAKYKNDEKGLGFEDKNDQWVKHEDDFNALLANLSNANDNSENLHSGISLEDKSKKSKARIHYHKFTRGKDISRYSEKDLANIFGKRSFKNTEEAQVSIKEDIKTTEQIFTEKGSMEDYFKNKLAEFKSKSKFKAPMVNENDLDYDEPNYGFQGFSQENDNVEFSNETNYHENNSINTKPSDKDVVCNLENFKIKKKSKTHYKTSKNDSEHSSNTDDQQNQKEIDGKIKEQKVKNKMKVVDNNREDQEYNEEKTKKKKLKNKRKLIKNNAESSTAESDGHEICIESTEDADQIYKNKKKSKNKVSKDVSPNMERNNVSVEHTNEKKSSKNKDLSEENLILHDIIKKKKSKRNNDLNAEEMLLQHDTNLGTLSKKKKKKKSKNYE